jgi:hypothetical protein
MFKNCTIYGHVLHGDISDVLESLCLNDLKSQDLKIKDSQTEFKRIFPK